MSLTITKRRERVEVVTYSREYRYRDMPGAGFGFTSDEYGHVKIDSLQPAGLDNYRKCQDGTYDVVDRGVQEYRSSYVEPGEGKCQCGRTVVLSGDRFGEGIDCECGRIYNSAGQELRPRSQWEENGEDY